MKEARKNLEEAGVLIQYSTAPRMDRRNLSLDDTAKGVSCLAV